MKRLSTKEMCESAIFAGVTAVLAQISIPLPFTPVPISMSLIAVYLTGMFLPPRAAVASQVVYLAIGAVGMPVFSGWQGGLGRLLGPTGGYLISYPIMAAIISRTLNPAKQDAARVSRLLYIKAFSSIAAALAVGYICGAIWLSYSSSMTLWEAVQMAVLPFVLIDMLKIAATILLFLPARQRFVKANVITL